MTDIITSLIIWMCEVIPWIKSGTTSSPGSGGEASCAGDGGVDSTGGVRDDISV
jgi:hypothetical protein